MSRPRQVIANQFCLITRRCTGDRATAPTAGGAGIGIITFGKATSLIRSDFITEILKSAEVLD